MSRILVTGGSSGLGAAIIKALEPKHEVFNFSYPDHDVRNFEDCFEFLRAWKWHKLDVLINCAGISPLNWIENSSPSEWNDVFDTNVKGIFNMVLAALPYLSSRDGYGMHQNPVGGDGGTILNICSTAAWTPMTCTHIYNTSKAAVHMSTLQMARELKPRHGISVFGVAPNKLDGTGISRLVEASVPGLRGWTEEEATAKQNAMIPAGKATPPEAVAELIAYFLQDKEHHRYLTGTVIQYGA